MSRKPAHFTQADIARAICGKTGRRRQGRGPRRDSSTIVFRITPTTDAENSLEPGEQITL